jgi:uncharacterized protein RhaS with RHS repeats
LFIFVFVQPHTTWVFEEGSFRPAAKLTKDKKYSIVTDCPGAPAQMYDEKGQAVWDTHLDIYGKVRTFAGCSLSDCPFRYQGQYEDAETGLYYKPVPVLFFGGRDVFESVSEI